MKYILTAIRAILIILNTAFQMTWLYLDSLINGKTKERGFKHRKKWAKRCIKILGIKIEEQLGNYDVSNALFISNHRTLLDPVIQTAFLDAYIIAKAEVSKLPVISQGAQMTGIIFVKRNKLKSRLAARNTTKDLLVSGQSVLVYAEGTTGTNITSDHFKPGTFAIAAEANVPVIPISIEYPERKDYWFEDSLGKQMLQQIGVWRTKVKLRFGAPITGNDAKTLMNAVKKEIDLNLLDMQSDWSKIFEGKEIEQARQELH